MRHTIAEVHFERRQNVGNLTCSCGQQMPSDEFAEHRRDNGHSDSHIKAGAMAVPRHESVWRRTNRCRNGHPMTPENTYVFRNYRKCRACRHEASRRMTERRKVAA